MIKKIVGIIAFPHCMVTYSNSHVIEQALTADSPKPFFSIGMIIDTVDSCSHVSGQRLTRESF